MNRVRAVMCLVFLTASVCPLGGAELAAAEEWMPLFNGQNLEGWTPKIKGYDYGENFGNTFRVAQGTLQVGYEQYDRFDERFGHLFHRRKFSHYRLRAEYRFVGTQVPGGPAWAIRNSGLMLHCESPESMAKDQSFPTSIEVQLLGGVQQGQARPTANLCSPGTNVVLDGSLFTTHCTQSRSDTYYGDQWVTVEVEVRGGKTIRHFVAGREVLRYESPQLDETDEYARKLIPANGSKILTEGYISIQSESHPIEFRKIELLELKH